jgi:ankyrin repeat protein
MVFDPFFESTDNTKGTQGRFMKKFSKYFASTLIFAVFFVSCLTTESSTNPIDPVEQDLLSLVKSDDVDSVKERLGFNEEVNKTTERGQSALHLAAIEGYHEIASLLVLRGADINLKDNEGKTPLRYALEYDQLLVLDVLIKDEAGLFVKDIRGVHPFKYAIEEKPQHLERLIGKYVIDQEDEFGNNLLHYAAESGRLEVVRLALEKGALADSLNSFSETPMDVALKNNTLEHAAVSAFLLEITESDPKDRDYGYLREFWPGDVNKTMDFGSTPLHFAAGRGHIGWVEFLIGKGAELEVKDRPGNTPLHKAVEGEHLSVVDILLKRGAEVNALDFSENSALHIALGSQKAQEMVQKLLENGADPNQKNSFGNTSVHLAVSLEKPIDVFDTLINGGADLNIRNKKGNGPLLEALQSNSEVISRYLLEKGSNIFAKNNEDQSPLSAALNGGVEKIRWILSKENINTQDDTGMTPLHMAVNLGSNLDVLASLIEIGASLDVREKSGNTALHLALLEAKMDVAAFLIENDAPLFTLNNGGVNPLALIFSLPKRQYEGMINNSFIAKTDSSNNTPLFPAVQIGSQEAVSLLVQAGADINHRNLSGSSPLHEAVRFGHLEIARFLIRRGADVLEKDNLGNTPLHNTVFWESLAMGELLIAEGASLEAKNNEGNTPFHEAVRRGERRLAAFFLEKGAKLLTRNSEGSLPIFDTVELDNEEMLSFLLEKGISPVSRDNGGNTPLHWALMNRSKKSIPLLVEAGSDIFAQNAKGETPVGLAINDTLEVLQIVWSKNMGDLQNDIGNTPLHLGVLITTDETKLRYLIEQSFDIDARNKNGKSALDLALGAKRDGVARILMENGAGE